MILSLIFHYIFPGKGPSIWDTFAHRGMLNGRSTGDIACDSYHKYKTDIQMVRNLGVSTLGKIFFLVYR